MAAEIVTATQKQVVQTTQTEHEGFMAILSNAATSGVSVENLAKLMELKERHERREAEKAFNIDFSLMSDEIPRVERNGTVNLGKDNSGKDRGSYNFARYEDIDRVVRPILAKYGFSMTFDAEPRQAEGGGVIVTGYLRHREGHVISASMDIVLDSGAGRSNNQARGSSISYGRRYVTEMLLNIVRTGADTDDSHSAISPETAAEIEKRIEATGADRAAFLNIFGVESVSALPENTARAAFALLAKKQRAAS